MINDYLEDVHWLVSAKLLANEDVCFTIRPAPFLNTSHSKTLRWWKSFPGGFTVATSIFYIVYGCEVYVVEEIFFKKEERK